MKTFRLLLAALSLATLAACGTQSITGPDAPSAGARRDVTPVAPTSTTESSTQSTTPGTTCQVTTDANGNTITTCTTEARGPVFGSGG